MPSSKLIWQAKRRRNSIHLLLNCLRSSIFTPKWNITSSTSKIIYDKDVKPPNIFITSNGLVKVGDFGISKRIQADMTPTTCTKNYRAPELFFGERNYDMSIDIWALGCTLVELVLNIIE